MDKRKAIRQVIGWFVYIAVLAGLIYGTPKILAYVLKTPYPMASITSGSMWPALKKGDMVLIKGIQSKDEIKVGDIVVYRNLQGFTIHRVTVLNEETLVTKGDANNVSDSPVKYSEVIGKTLYLGQKPFRIPYLGNISILIRKSKM